MTANYFCILYKSKRKHNQHSELLFLMINGYFDTPNYLHIEKQDYFSKTVIIWFYFPLKSEENLFRWVHYFLLICLKRSISQTFKSSNCEKFFSSMHVIVTTRFDKCFLFHVIAERQTLFFIKLDWYSEVP